MDTPGPPSPTGGGLGGDVLRRVDAVLARLPDLAGAPREVRMLPGGLTNRNVLVVTPGRKVVVRLSEPAGGLLAIDRSAEHVNSVRAAASGAAPAVVGYLPEHGALVVEWVEGRTLGAADLHDEEMLHRVAAACRRLHAGPRFLGDFDMATVQRRYLSVVQQHGFRLPDGYLDLLPEVDRVSAATAVRAGPTVPCNNDLLAANLVDDGDRLWVIDYEYGGNNDPSFELGNAWQESELSVEHLEVLVGSYLGAPVRHQVARARLFGLLACYGWTLWASIQDAVSPIEFDFWSWGLAKYERAAAGLRGPAYERLLVEATRRD